MLPFIDIYQLGVVILAIVATFALLFTCYNEWRESEGQSKGAFRIAIAAVALLMVEFGSMASLGVKVRWWPITGWAEWFTTAGRSAMFTLVVWLAIVKWEEYKEWRARTQR